jgi:hypothetical protein
MPELCWAARGHWWAMWCSKCSNIGVAYVGPVLYCGACFLAYSITMVGQQPSYKMAKYGLDEGRKYRKYNKDRACHPNPTQDRE